MVTARGEDAFTSDHGMDVYWVGPGKSLTLSGLLKVV